MIETLAGVRRAVERDGRICYNQAARRAALPAPFTNPASQPKHA